MITSGVALSMLLQACSLTPKYERPALPAETSAWPQGEAYGESPNQGMAAADIGWQSFFQDPALKKLIAVDLDSNRDLRVAALNFDTYRAQFRVPPHALFPNLDGAVIDSPHALTSAPS